MVYSKHAEERPSLVGQIVDGGALLLLETLGAGAYGTVYRALELHSDNGTQRAVKVLEKPRLDRRTAKFHARELQLHTLVSGLPGILPLHRHFEDEHHIFVVLALVAGGDLHARITQGHVFWRNDELVRDALLQLTDALGACHARGVYHRDVKPENILCSADGRTLWLADFGLASVDQVSTSHGCGSGHYMAPEVIGREFAGRTPYLTRGADVWALGVVLVNIVAGRSPWRRALLRDPGFEHFVDDPDYLRTVLPISEACNELVNRACCIDPLERISMREFREEILKVDTFFMSEEELEEASWCAQRHARYYATRGEPEQAEEDEMEQRDREHDKMVRLAAEEMAAQEVAVHIDSCYLKQNEATPKPTPRPLVAVNPDSNPISPVDPVAPAGAPTAETPVEAPPTDAFVIANDDEVSSSSSAPEEQGPETPETHPVHPEVEVPALTDGENLGEVYMLYPGRPPVKLTKEEMRLRGIVPGIEDGKVKRRSSLARALGKLGIA